MKKHPFTWWQFVRELLQIFSAHTPLRREVGPGHRPEFIERKEPRTNF